MRRKITVADLFCGAGGTSTGLRQACEQLGLTLNLLAVNHWDIAIQTHATNHPEADHLCSTLDSVDPRKAVPSGHLDLLIASPECTHHSLARGGKPVSDQSRASAWRIVEWCSQIYVDHVLIENVKEFQTWGPLSSTGRPLERQKGAIYFAFLNALQSLGYTVEARVLNAADYGDATSRERLFIQARKGRKSIQWPQPTHGPAVERAGPLFDEPYRQPHRSASEIIDWSLPGESIFRRKRPLAPATMDRIFKGLEKFRGLPFMVKYYGGADCQGLNRPLPTVTANYEHYGLAQPFLINYNGTGSPQSLDDPLNTVTTKDRFGLCQPREGVELDVLFRMLQPHELAAAMGFPRDYVFHGTREQRVRQIGNAVPVGLASNLCRAILEV